jgi:hypothetical protein
LLTDGVYRKTRPSSSVLASLAVPNLEKLGYTTTALIGLQITPAKQEAVADAIARLAEVHYVAITPGPTTSFSG